GASLPLFAAVRLLLAILRIIGRIRSEYAEAAAAVVKNGRPSAAHQQSSLATRRDLPADGRRRDLWTGQAAARFRSDRRRDWRLGGGGASRPAAHRPRCLSIRLCQPVDLVAGGFRVDARRQLVFESQREDAIRLRAHRLPLWSGRRPRPS